jgi:hypothetical protein
MFIYSNKILGTITHNVPVVCDVPGDADRRRRVCALGWCCFPGSSFPYQAHRKVGHQPESPRYANTLGGAEERSDDAHTSLLGDVIFMPVCHGRQTGLPLLCLFLFILFYSFSSIKLIFPVISYSVYFYSFTS